MDTIEEYKSALKYLEDIELLDSTLDTLLNAKSEQEFEHMLRTLINQLAVIKLHAEYYYKEDYKEQYLSVETFQLIDFPKIKVNIGFDYAFTKGFKLSSCTSYCCYNNKSLSVEEAKKVFSGELQKVEKKAS